MSFYKLDYLINKGFIMEENILKLKTLIEEKKVNVHSDSHEIKDYIEIVNDLVDCYFVQGSFDEAKKLLAETYELFPDLYKIVSSGIYRNVGKIFVVNYYLVSNKFNCNESLQKAKDLKEKIDFAEHEDISRAQDIRTAEEANIVNRIDLYKKKYKLKDNFSTLDLEKEKIFKELFWSDFYENHKFSWE